MGAPLIISRHKLSIDDYHRMGDADILHEDSHVELIEGELIDMAPIGSLHSSIVIKLSMMLSQQVAASAFVSTQNPITLPPNNEPQPDLVLLKPRDDWYSNALPTSTDVLLLIEIADTSIEYDRQVKLPLYAQHGIQEVWLFDVKERLLEIYRDPGKRGYRKLLRPDKKEIVSPLLVDIVHVPLAEIWPA